MTETLRVITAEEFEGFPARVKGYVVYFLGADKAQPHVPRHWEPGPGEAEEYAAGQAEAVQEMAEAVRG